MGRPANPDWYGGSIVTWPGNRIQDIALDGCTCGSFCDVEQVPGSFRGTICDVEQVPGSFRGRICDVEQVPQDRSGARFVTLNRYLCKKSAVGWIASGR